METNDWIETHSGKKFYTLHPRTEDIDIYDIAHSLSNQCRYNGHTIFHYSVAEHACLFSDYVLEKHQNNIDAFTALHHDDGESFIGDMVKPLKQHMTSFTDVENKVDQVLAEKFKTQWPFPSWLKEYDTRIIVDERSQVLNKSKNVWFTDSFEPLGIKIQGWSNIEARAQYLKRHFYLENLIC